VFAALGLEVAAMVAIQFSNAIAADAFSRAGPLGVTGVRMVTGAVALLLVVRPLATQVRAEPWLVAGFGGVIAANAFLLFEAFAHLPLGIAVTVAFLGPLGVSVANSRRAVDLVWPASAVCGVALLAGITGGGNISGLGLCFALLSAAGWGIYIVLAAATGIRFAGVGGLALATVVAAVVCAPVALGSAGLRVFEPRVLLLGGTSGVLGFALAHGLETQALRRVSKRLFGVFASLEPAIAVLAGLLFLGQHLRPLQLVGIVIVMLASAGAVLSRRRGGPRAGAGGPVSLDPGSVPPLDSRK
jgi:inner membrane transporter RhtA